MSARVAAAARLALKKRGRQKRLDKQVEVVGRTRFRTPGSFEWHRTGRAGAWVPRGSYVRVPEGGRATIGGRATRGGTLTEVK